MSASLRIQWKFPLIVLGDQTLKLVHILCCSMTEQYINKLVCLLSLMELRTMLICHMLQYKQKHGKTAPSCVSDHKTDAALKGWKKSLQKTNEWSETGVLPSNLEENLYHHTGNIQHTCQHKSINKVAAHGCILGLNVSHISPEIHPLLRLSLALTLNSPMPEPLLATKVQWIVERKGAAFSSGWSCFKNGHSLLHDHLKKP